MEASEYIYYGFGHIAFAIAKADGQVQFQEEQKLHDVVIKHLKDKFSDISISEIIFNILKDDYRSPEELYEYGITQIDLGSHHLNAEIKDLLMKTAVAVADAFPPFSKEENHFVMKLQNDLGRMTKDIII
jgi:uncharacterized tellurite resistance protein B-like protein